MSYDVAVFDASVAPTERKDFEEWFSMQTDWEQKSVVGDLSRVSPALCAWYKEIQESYPSLGSPGALDSDASGGEIRAASYSISPHVIYMAFPWTIAFKAFREVLKSASLHGIGVYDVSDVDRYGIRIFYPKDCDALQVTVEYDDEEYSGKSKLALYETLELFDGMKWGKGSFMQFKIARGRLFQIYGEGGGRLIAEFTTMEKGERDSFLQKRMDKETCRRLLYDVFGMKQVRPEWLEGCTELSATAKRCKDMPAGEKKNAILTILFAVVVMAFLVYLAIRRVL